MPRATVVAPPRLAGALFESIARAGRKRLRFGVVRDISYVASGRGPGASVPLFFGEHLVVQRRYSRGKRDEGGQSCDDRPCPGTETRCTLGSRRRTGSEGSSLPTAVSLESRLGAILEASASVSQDYGRTSARLRGVLQLVRLQERHEHTAAVREDECSREATASRRESQCGLDDGGAWRPTVRLARTERRRHGSFRGPTVRELLAVLAMARRCPQRSRRTPGS